MGPSGHQGLQSNGEGRPLPQSGGRPPAHLHSAHSPGLGGSRALPPEGPRVCLRPVDPRAAAELGGDVRDRRVDLEGAAARDPPRGGGLLPGREDLEAEQGPQVPREGEAVEGPHESRAQPSGGGGRRRDGSDLAEAVWRSHVGSVGPPRPSPCDLQADHGGPPPDGDVQTTSTRSSEGTSPRGRAERTG